MRQTKTCNKVIDMSYQSIFSLKFLSIIIALSVLCLCAFAFHEYSIEIVSWIDKLGWFAPILFLLVYCLATLLFLPTMVLTLAGGAIFGPIIGTMLNLIGATLGAAFAFLITRHLIYDWFSNQSNEKINKIIAGVDQKGWVFVAFLRLFPIIPFNIVNYGLGITGINFRIYLFTTFVFLIPAEIVYTYFGYAGMDVIASPENFYRNTGMVLSACAILFLTIIKLIRKK